MWLIYHVRPSPINIVHISQISVGPCELVARTIFTGKLKNPKRGVDHLLLLWLILLINASTHDRLCNIFIRLSPIGKKWPHSNALNRETLTQFCIFSHQK